MKMVYVQNVVIIVLFVVMTQQLTNFIVQHVKVLVIISHLKELIVF